MKTIAQLNARTTVLARSSKTLAENIHHHMVDIVEHFKEHGDTSAMTLLHNVLHSAVRRNAIKNWCEAFAGMKFVAESKDKQGKVKPAHFIRNKDIPFEQIDLDACRENSPWDFTPEPVWKGFDLKKELARLVKRAEKEAEENAGNSKLVIDEDVLAKVKEIVA